MNRSERQAITGEDMKAVGARLDIRKRSWILIVRDVWRIMCHRCLVCGQPARTLRLYTHPSGRLVPIYGLECRLCHGARSAT
jgi:hypothetical protein